jgi:hypothetical protein
MSRRLHIALAATCAVVAVLLVLLAVDIRSWQTTVARDDVRFRVLPAHDDLWQPATVLPGDPAGALIGTHSTVAYRRALQYFWFSRTGAASALGIDGQIIRARAQQTIEKLVTGAPTPTQRSAAANLLGVLVVTTPSASDPGGTTPIFVRAAQYFQQAIALDAGNTDAKQNLELVLRLEQPGKQKRGSDARSGHGFGQGRAAAREGNGY